MRKVLILIVLPLLFLFCGSWHLQARAEEVLEAMEHARRDYLAGEKCSAERWLERARRLVRRKEIERLLAVLPEAPEGWDPGEPTHLDVDRVFFGGGLSVERSYHKGESEVRVSIITDSPVVQGLNMLLSSPMLLALRGVNIEMFGGEEAIVSFCEEGLYGEITVPVKGRYFVTVQGEDISLDDMRHFAELVVYHEL